jgi:transcription elongation factor Elf1
MQKRVASKFATVKRQGNQMEIKISTVTLKRKQICPFCDFELLNEDVPLGKIYEIIEQTKQNGALICGGCHYVTLLEIVQVACGGFLPTEIFNTEVVQ